LEWMLRARSLWDKAEFAWLAVGEKVSRAANRGGEGREYIDAACSFPPARSFPQSHVRQPRW
jgi:hypothetical protein